MSAKKYILIIILLLSVCVVDAAQKREFRGAWIQCVNGQFLGMGTEKMQRTLTYQLDELQKDGVNAIIFQVRPECDALYQSSLEPWSRFLTGVQGVAPSPYWDPLQWMIDECHKRGMELHAWINPFRAKTKVTNELSPIHIAKRYPQLIFPYDGLYILNPAKAENREWICRVAGDIVRRYDIDGLHIDDYFYPYPVAGLAIPDMNDYQSNNNGYSDIRDWRRHNVDIFIKQLHDTIQANKPWVKFGVSPFGIYRNKKNAPEIGSNTNGLQNYDDLYADVLLWINEGWIDYCVPQIYWEIGNKAADYDTLIRWWSQYAAKRPLFIGEDIERTAKYADLNVPQQNQMAAKYQLHEQLPNISGTVLWYAKAAVDNVGNYGTMLRTNYWRYPALQPLMPFIDKTIPAAPKKLRPVMTSDGKVLFWDSPKSKSWRDEAVKYVVYRFKAKEKIDIENPSNIVAITTNTWYRLPEEDGKTKYVYVVTSLNRLSNESKIVKKAIKL
ncbi:MAG: family 10 glycosylhydrolase [Prevotella sp.]|nr:family 10 glycosylhydrolase [Candidatus Prevotella equi]